MTRLYANTVVERMRRECLLTSAGIGLRAWSRGIRLWDRIGSHLERFP